MNSVPDSIHDSSVVVCCGPGGVGKTTLAATIALRSAQEGRRVCVLTVDPARRLADALGLQGVGNTPMLVPNVKNGTLHALMLDTEGTFDALIDSYATSELQASTIKENRLYQNLASALSGTQEYMAMEKLYELTTSGDFDLVVVDTPPTRNALDLLDAPQRLSAFLHNRVFRALLTPTKAYLRAVSIATRAILSTIGSVAGSELLSDIVTFFQAFAGMEEGFASRAQAVHELLLNQETIFLLVTSPRHDAIEEAKFFADRLTEANLRASGVLVNRVHPLLLEKPLSERLLKSQGSLGALAHNLENLQRQAFSERNGLEGLREAVWPTPVIGIPLSQGTIHDMAGLEQMGQFLDQ